MGDKLRTRVVVLLCVAACALLAAYVVDASDEPASAEPFPLRSVPGIASDEAGGPQAPVFASAGATIGPPAWVKPGVRVTYYSAAASVAQSRFAWVEDPDGTWEDPATGTHYRRTDETGEGVSTASGDGVSQVDVLAVEGTDVVLSMTLYGIDHASRTFVPGGTTGASLPGGEIDGLWVNPTRLAQLQELNADGVMVLRGPYALAGKTYQAISFAVTSAGAYQQYTYDTRSGVLLSATSATPGAISSLADPTEGPPQGNTQLTVTFFAGARRRSLPGLDGTSPAWVAGSPRLSYAGTYYWANPVDPSSGTLTSPMSIDVSLRPGGDSWASYAARTTVARTGSTTNGSGVTGPTGLYWLSPQTLAAMRSAQVGQVLDRDPVTGEQLVVQAVSGNLLTLDSRLPGITTRAGYDLSSGVLTTYAAQVPASGTTIDLHLTSGG